MPADRDAAEIRAAWGVKWSSAFPWERRGSWARFTAAPEAYAPGPAFGRTSNWVSARKRTSTTTGISELV